MSTALQDARKLTVFPSVRKGDTLIVSPAGDAAGFGGAQFAVEQSRVLKALEEPGIRNVIVDLRNANYIGGTMIGALNRFVVKARERGGRAGFCHLSADMDETVRILNLQQLWAVYPTRAAAVKDIVVETVPQQLAANRQSLAVLGCLALAVAAWFSVPLVRGRLEQAAAADRYRELAALWDDLQVRRATVGKPLAWEEESRLAARKVEACVVRATPRSGTRDSSGPARLHLFWAARYELLPLVKAQRRDRHPDREQRFRSYMESARVAIEKQTGTVLEPIRPPFGSDVWPDPNAPQPAPAPQPPAEPETPAASPAPADGSDPAGKVLGEPSATPDDSRAP